MPNKERDNELKFLVLQENLSTCFLFLKDKDTKVWEMEVASLKFTGRGKVGEMQT